jgi:hypothetical protein
MNWWMNFYFAEGPGIAKDAPPATGLRLLGQTLAREWWNLILLNVIFLAALLPVVTIPAAIVAMVRVTTLMAHDEPNEPWRDFRDTFLAVFWRASACGVLVAGVIASGSVALRVYADAAQANILYVAPLAIAFAATILAVVFAVYIAHLLASHRAPLSILLKAAGIATFLKPLPVLAALGANFSLWLLHVAAYPSSVILAVTVNFSLGALFLSFAARNPMSIAFAHVSRRSADTQQEPRTETEGLTSQ